ncbi:hypothetical protein EW145_g1150 [Phellinidium pouzarii]|uniref:Uncharacterized protein n=1 Tax=Phellinidium pouzarii TaxID=167371 RepID=A0A4S4LFL2_9AGAM|nr:hypothetical protein EW145_g1150 [Phellinidium pouzarii]
MPTPPFPKQECLENDAVGAFIPKSEDSGVVFPLFDGSPSDGLLSSSSLLSDAGNPFDPAPDSSLQSSSSSSLTQLDMDVLNRVSAGNSSNVFLSGFSSSQQMQLLSAASDDMQGVLPFREESPGSTGTPSSDPSLAASPAPPPFSNVSTSSLASALDDHRTALLSRSRSGSLASPNTTGFAPRVSPPLSSNGPTFAFQLPDGMGRPDPVNAPHMLVVDDVLFGIMRAAASARQACSMGQSVEASSKIDEMKKQIALVSDLMAATMLDKPSQEGSNGQIHLPGPPSSSGVPNHRHSMSLPGLSQSSTPGSILNFQSMGLTSLSSGPPSLEQPAAGHLPVDIGNGSGIQGSPDSDTSRKRCASSMAGNRINKAIRLDSVDGSLPPLTQPATPPKSSNISSVLTQPQSASQQPSFIKSSAVPLPGNVQIPLPPSTTTGPLTVPLTPMNGVALSGASPPSIPPSRPESPPASLTAPQDSSWSMIQKHLSASAPVTTIHPTLTQTQPVFPLTMPSNMSMTDLREHEGEFEMANPANTRTPWENVAGQASILGSGIGTVHPQDLIAPSSIPYEAPLYPPPGHAALPTGTLTSNQGISAATMSRSSRSSSFSNALGNKQAMAYGAPSDCNGVPVQQHSPPEYVPSQDGRSRARSRASMPTPRSPSSSSCDDDDSDYEGAYGHARRNSKSSPPLRSRDSSQERPSLRQRQSGSSPGEGLAHGNDIPPEYRAEVDRVFFEFLNKICSNLDATDAKGELIHQTLMAKKMQRLDESPDFRPFKFRIQAFTNGFLEELARQGYSEEKIAMKKVRNYLWTQPYISRFNEDGKKAKSKGNHIWNIDAKKRTEGGWDFRPFHRKLAGSPPGVAYIGLRWTWTPRIWDPQASRANIQVQYSSPNLPSWLSWRDGILQGYPPSDAQSCEVTVEARTVQDGCEELLSQSFPINISVVPTGTDLSFNSARPSLVVDPHNPRRVNSDSMVPASAGATARPLQALPQSMAQAPALTTQDAQMMQVLTSAAQRVAQEAQAHVIAAHNPNDPPGLELQALAKQQHVLTVTAQALDQEVSAPPNAVSPSSHALVAAAQQVVFQAARQVAADRTAVMSLATGVPAPQAPSGGAVTVNEVSVATQTAVAQAVEITGPLSSEVDVMMTASSLLQQQTRPPTTVIEPALSSTLDLNRPHSTGTLSQQFSAVLSNTAQQYPTPMPLPSMGPADF